MLMDGPRGVGKPRASQARLAEGERPPRSSQNPPAACRTRRPAPKEREAFSPTASSTPSPAAPVSTQYSSSLSLRA